jgi:hypothetical protein
MSSVNKINCLVESIHLFIGFYSGRCVFGIDTDMQYNINNPYLQKSAASVEMDANKMILFKLSNLMPFLAGPLRSCMFAQIAISQTLTKMIPLLKKYIPEMPGYSLMNRVQDVVDLRTKSSSNITKRVDLLQSMIDASTNEDIEVSFYSYTLKSIALI